MVTSRLPRWVCRCCGCARCLLIAASLATASAVAFSGIIGFIGLIVPHIMRLAFGADHRRLLPLSLLGGAALLLLSDVLARVVMSPRNCRLASSPPWRVCPSSCGSCAGQRTRGIGNIYVVTTSVVIAP